MTNYTLANSEENDVENDEEGESKRWVNFYFTYSVRTKMGLNISHKLTTTTIENGYKLIKVRRLLPNVISYIIFIFSVCQDHYLSSGFV